MLQKIFNKVIIDGQAVLYAMIMRIVAEDKGDTVTDIQFEAWQDEYKQETRSLLNKIMDGDHE